MADEATVAAAPQGETENISNTNLNTEPTPAAAPQPQPTPAQPDGNYIRLTDEQMKFFTGQGMKSGDEFSAKAFEQYKKYMSNPQPQTPEPTQAPEPQQQVQQPTQPQPQQQGVQGGISMEELGMMTYFDRLSQEKAYEGIADEVRDGSVIREMRQFGIEPMVNGRVNSTMIKRFLDLKAKTVPAAPQQTPAASNIPTVEYREVGDKIASRADAEAVIRQSLELRAAGQPEHPKMAEARQFLAKDIFNK